MTNFIWNVTQLYTETIEGKEDYVVLANCETIGVDGEYTASVPNVIQFSTEEVGTFIPYADLTEEIVIGWMGFCQLKRLFKVRLIRKSIPPLHHKLHLCLGVKTRKRNFNNLL
jgi:hypothetical protein